MRPKEGLTSLNVLRRRMARISKICLYTCGIVMSLLALLPSLKQSPVTSPAKTPRRFFPAGSSVLDFPFGNMSPIVDLLQKEEILFVMYYAPWCAQSIVVREEYQKAAKFMIDKVKFVGVNCWWPEGSCRNTFKFLKYPELYVYHTNLDGFRFNGIPTAEELIKFVEDILYPFKLLHNAEGINNYTALHDNIAVGYFNLSTPTPPGLKSFYIAAMRMIEKNHLQPVRFFVISKPVLSALLGMNDTQQFVLLNLNGSSIYPIQNNFTSSSIIKWINVHKIENIVKWVSVQGHKSLQLSSQLNRGPALLVFAPINRLHTVGFYQLMLRELALKYRNCSNKTLLILIEHIIKRHRQNAMQSVLLSKDCLPPSLNNLECCVTVHRQNDVCELCRRKFNYKTKYNCDTSLFSDIPGGEFEKFNAPSCLDSYGHYNINDYRTLTCQPYSQLSSHSCSTRHSTDPFVHKTVNDFTKSKCKRLSLQKSLFLDAESRIFNDDIDRDPVVTEFTGFKCRTNKTVNFFVLDKSKHKAFLTRLGTFIPMETNLSVSVIIDKQNEVQHILQKPFSKLNIANFVMDFTKGDLSRHQRTEVNPPVCTSDVCISDATSSTFHRIVMDQNKDVMMLVYSPWCGFCASAAHIYLTLARYFRSGKHIIFSRINGDENDLPWQYTIDKYPTFLFFPAHRKADSMKFPETVPLTLSNLIKFVLSHATHDLRMDTAIDVCTKPCIQNNLRKVSETIVFNIRRRKLVENRIEKLKEQYLSKEMSVRFKSAINVLYKRLKKIDRLYKNAFILLKFLKSSQMTLDKVKLKHVLDNKNNMKIDNPGVLKNDIHDEL